MDPKNMREFLKSLPLDRLIVLGFQNNLLMTQPPFGMTHRAFILNGLYSLDVIHGLETSEDGS